MSARQLARAHRAAPAPSALQRGDIQALIRLCVVAEQRLAAKRTAAAVVAPKPIHKRRRTRNEQD